MSYTQRDIVMVSQHTVPTGQTDPHPFIIISCEQAIGHEPNRAYTGVMITHSTQIDRYSFELTKDMVDGNLGSAFSQARLHIIGSFNEPHIVRGAYLGKMKKSHFEQLLKQIKDYIFKLD